MSASDPSRYEEILIESSESKETVDLRPGVQSVDYYEDIFRPYVTAKILVTSSGPVINGKGIYQGLPLKGGERVSLRIKQSVNGLPGLDFSQTPDDYLYVSGISNYISDSTSETFILNLCSKVAITNETTRVTKRYPTSQNISGSVEQIVKEYLNVPFAEAPHQTENKYGFIGNMRKPFTVIRWLASKGVDSETAGFVFYQTKEGMHFKSLNKMIEQKPKALYSETMVADGKGEQNEDFKISTYYLDKNQNVIEKLKLGAYSSMRYYFDFHRAAFTREQEGVYLHKDHIKKTNTLGSQDPGLPKVNSTDVKPLDEYPTRIMSGFIDRGTLEDKVDTTKNADPFQYQSQSLYRYADMFTQKVEMTVPMNTSLKAGDIIECDFRQTATGKEESDPIESGLYMIKQLRHHFDKEGSYTAMMLIRDTIGKK